MPLAAAAGMNSSPRRALLSLAPLFFLACGSSSEMTGDAAPAVSTGVCSEATTWPDPAIAGGSSRCILWSCGAVSGAIWNCSRADGGDPCGVRPTDDFDGCLQWSCAAGVGWRGAWLCADLLACPLGGRPSGCDCFCDPKKGGWICATPTPGCAPPRDLADAGPDFGVAEFD
jgi:hypothetical protein